MSTVHATIADRPYDLSREQVEAAMFGVTPEPIRAHYTVVGGCRFPPKQVIAVATGLDRSAFITTQARRILERLGFAVGRIGSPPEAAGPSPDRASTAYDRLEREAELLRPYRGQFVAVDPDWTEVVASGPDPRTVSRALRAVGRVGVIFQVPVDPTRDVGGFAW